MDAKVLEYQKLINKLYKKNIAEDGNWGTETQKAYEESGKLSFENLKKVGTTKSTKDSLSKPAKDSSRFVIPSDIRELYNKNKTKKIPFAIVSKKDEKLYAFNEKGEFVMDDEVLLGKTKGDFPNVAYQEGAATTPAGEYILKRDERLDKTKKGYDANNIFKMEALDDSIKPVVNPKTGKKALQALHGVPVHLKNQRGSLLQDGKPNNRVSAGCINCNKKFLDSEYVNNLDIEDFRLFVTPESRQFGGEQSGGGVNEVIQAYIEAKQLDENSAQQLVTELQNLPKEQLQQVVIKMQEQLQPSQEEMQYGGEYEKWKKSLPKNLQSTDTTLYNLRGAYEGGLTPELAEDGMYHLGSRNPKTGELLKNSKHPTFNKMIEGEAQAGYEVYEKDGKLYSKPKLKQQYGGLPIDEEGLYNYPNQSVVVPTNNTGSITMEGINYPVDAYNADTMQHLDTMQPNQQYQFEGVNNVLEVPQARFGITKAQNGFKPWRESNTKIGHTTVTGADSRNKLSDAEFRQYWESWKKVIPNLSSTPKEAQKQIYQYAVKHNPESVKKMWRDYGLTGRQGVIENVENFTQENLSVPYFVDNFADGILGARSLRGMVAPTQIPVLTPPTLNAPNPLTPTKPMQVSTTPIVRPSGELPAEEEINPADAIIGKLDNRNLSGRALSNMKLRNNAIKLPYFGRQDLQTPRLYQQDVQPYINELYTANNAVKQNIDLNSATGQGAAVQLAANLEGNVNKATGQIYNSNMQNAINWENAVNSIYNQQGAIDDTNRRTYSNEVDQTLQAKQNVDNQIDVMAYENMQQSIRDKNKMILSTLLHPDFYTEQDGTNMILKRKYNKAPTAKAETKSAKFGLKMKC